MEPEQAKTYSLLVVDDDEGFRNVIKDILAEAGYAVDDAGDGKTAVDAASKTPYDIIVLDVKMPGMDGMEALKLIRQYSPGSDILMLTGVHDISIAVEAVKLGAREFLTKPIETDALLQNIRTTLRARAAEKKVKELEIEFSSRLLYELRNPITIGKSGVGFLLKGMAGPLSDQQFEVLSNMELNIDKLLVILSDMIDLTKLESGKVNLKMAQANLNEFLPRIGTLYEPRAKAKKVSFAIDLQKDLPVIQMDAEKINQVISNLLDNALKYTNEGGSITLKAVQVPQEDKHYAALTVQDSGVGIPPDELPYVFDKYKEFLTGKTSQKKTTGLGLAICRKIVEAHHGSITAQSEVGKGSSFTFLLPV
jgi:signal transduction histidine kinase